METNVREDRLLIISDLHIGNPLCKARRQITEFLEYAGTTNYSLCIDGDALDIVQTSITRLAREAPDIMSRLSQIISSGLKVYYVVGNHDIVFEHFIEAWGGFHVVPFLNVLSGDKRIRVEHGHLYDPFFVKHPILYEFSTAFAGYLLNMYPGVFRLWMKYERLKAGHRKKIEGAIVGEDPAFAEAVCELARRGFDTVTFGHTHRAGTVKLGNGKTYINCGSWLSGFNYVQIDCGKVELKRWEGLNREPSSAQKRKAA